MERFLFLLRECNKITPPFSASNAVVLDILRQTKSLQEGMDIVLADSRRYKPELRQLVTQHPAATIRLWAAWSLAELHDKQSVPILKKAYFAEPDAEVRVNIVWALFLINPESIPLPLYRAFMADEHFAIPMICIQYIRGLRHLEGKIDFVQLYQNTLHIAVRIELLKNVRSFAYDPDTIGAFLERKLSRSSEDWMMVAHIIRAIAQTNRIDSVDILIRFYRRHRQVFFCNELLALELADAAHHLGRSKLYHILYDIYVRHTANLVRSKIKEALLLGGSCCDDVMQQVIEYDEQYSCLSNALYDTARSR